MSRKEYNARWYQEHREEEILKQRERYKNNRTPILERAKQHRTKKRKLIDKIALAYGCRNPKCKWKGTFHPAQLEFHHFDPTLKKFQIGKAADYSFKAIAAEINKCIVLCACCHALFHVGLVTLSESYICRINENLEITNDTE